MFASFREKETKDQARISELFESNLSLQVEIESLYDILHVDSYISIHPSTSSLFSLAFVWTWLLLLLLLILWICAVTEKLDCPLTKWLSGILLRSDDLLMSFRYRFVCVLACLLSLSLPFSINFLIFLVYESPVRSIVFWWSFFAHFSCFHVSSTSFIPWLDTFHADTRSANVNLEEGFWILYSILGRFDGDREWIYRSYQYNYGISVVFSVFLSLSSWMFPFVTFFYSFRSAFRFSLFSSREKKIVTKKNS